MNCQKFPATNVLNNKMSLAAEIGGKLNRKDNLSIADATVLQASRNGKNGWKLLQKD